MPSRRRDGAVVIGRRAEGSPPYAPIVKTVSLVVAIRTPVPKALYLKGAADWGIPLGGALLGPGHPSYPIYLIPFSEKSKASPVNFL